MNMRNHIIIFVDIRNFTSWSNDVDIMPHLGEFASSFQEMIKRHFEPGAKLLENVMRKNQGDGALILFEVKQDASAAVWREILADVVARIEAANKDFDAMCAEFGRNKGVSVDLCLGWGVVKGAVARTEDGDFIGSPINKCARLCGLARPFGVVIDAENFQEVEGCGLSLYKQLRKLKGVHKDAAVWVTKEIASQFATRESMRQNPEVHVAGVCYNPETKKILVAKRADNRKILPGMYEGCGGQLAPRESFTDGVKRHFELEFGIKVNALEDVHVFYTIRQADVPVIPGIFFLCLYRNGTADSANHQEIKWLSESELQDLREDECVPHFREHVKRLLAQYRDREN